VLLNFANSTDPVKKGGALAALRLFNLARGQRTEYGLLNSEVGMRKREKGSGYLLFVIGCRRQTNIGRNFVNLTPVIYPFPMI
jgi:hypothetical protein